MAKKTANNAIDFARLFAVKEQVAREAEIEERSPAPPPIVSEVREEAREAAGEDLVDVVETAPPSVDAVTAPAAVAEQADATILAFPTEALGPSSKAEEDEAAAPIATASARRRRAPRVDPEPERDVFLRIGMTRELHDRLRASAALAGKSSTAFARDLLEERTPELDPTAPMAKLAKLARDAVAVTSSRRPIEVRMQVPATDALHRRLLQFAALRSQTLSAALLDIFEASVARM